MRPFPGLPSDLGRQCLLRVPYKFHHNLTTVCRSWNAVVNSPQFYQDRKNLGTSQQCICLIEISESRVNNTDNDLQFVITVYDPLQGTWETLPRLPHFPGPRHGIPLFCDCVSVNQKLFLIGGWNPCYNNVLSTVFIYDFSSAKWSRGADLPAVRISIAFSVSPEGLVYFAGGKDNDENALRGAAVYSVEEDEWKLLPDMSRERNGCCGAFIDGKFFVIGVEPDNDRFQWSAEVYDPKRGAWTTIQKEEGPPPFDCAVVSSDGRFYSFQKQLGVMEYDFNKNVWKAVGSFPETLGRITCCVAWRDSIFVSGYAEGTRDMVFYMLKPPPTGETFGKWAAIERPQHSDVSYVHCIMSAVTVEI